MILQNEYGISPNSKKASLVLSCGDEDLDLENMLLIDHIDQPLQLSIDPYRNHTVPIADRFAWAICRWLRASRRIRSIRPEHWVYSIHNQDTVTRSTLGLIVLTSSEGVVPPVSRPQWRSYS